MTEAHAYAQTLGEEQSVWFKISPFVSADNPMEILMRMSEKRGSCFPVRLKSEKIYFLSDIEHIRHVLVDNVDNYNKYFEGLKPVFGKAMITIDGALWQKIRKPQQPFFHPGVYEEYFPHLMAAARSKIDEWSDLAASGEEVEILEQTWGLAADMACRALFDREMPFNPQAVFGAVKAYTDVANHKAIRTRKMSGEVDEVSDDEEAAQAIAAWLSLPDAISGAKPIDHREKTLLKMLQDAQGDPDAPEFDRQQVLDEIKQYLWAGTETTALTLGWIFYLLHRHPDVAEKIRREGEEVYGDREPTWDDIQKLNYTRAVMLETLRLYPPAWALMRTAAQRDEIGGYQIEPSDKMVLSPYMVHHNPKYWENPDVFDPGRFLPGRIKKRVKYSYLPFGAGKRFCLGGQLSQLETVLALTMLLRRFRLEYVGDGPAKFSASVMLTPKGGLPFRVHKLS
ncbi:MAG: cytochrome P450 [Hyphomicrobiaceae bacterium]|nr:cytochrome P450 [Hyphomicrobiaceae bacterium]